MLFFLVPSFTWHDAFVVQGIVLTLLLMGLLASLATRLTLQATLLTQAPERLTPEGVTEYLRSIMRDPTIRLRFYDRTVQDFVTPPSRDSRPTIGRADVECEVIRNGRGETVGIFDGSADSVRAWNELHRFRFAAVQIIENAQLQAVLASRVDDLDTARRALVEQRRAAVRLQDDLHNTVQQTLYATRLELLNKETLGNSGVETAIEKVDRAINQVRAVSRGSVPMELWASLEASIQDMADELDLRALIAVQSPGRSELDDVILSICSEALTNIHKHADADEVLIRLFSREGQLILEVMDDGVGGASARPDGRGGVKGIRKQALDSGGHLAITSTPGIGTKVTATWPLPSES